MEIINQPKPGDVLCGRGKNSFRHEGNHHFRQVIMNNASLYTRAKTKQQKTQVVLLVSYTIIERGGRFLVRSDDGKSWRNGGLKQGKLKAGHAFRDVVRGRFQRLQRTWAAAVDDNTVGKQDESLDCYNRAPNVFERDAPGSLAVANKLNNIGLELDEKKELDKALDHYQRALGIEERLAPNSLTVATTLTNIGLSYAKKGSLDESHKYLRRALEIVERDAPDSLVLASTLHCVGFVLDEKGKLVEALEYFRRSLAIKEREVPDSLSLATTLGYIGFVHYRMKRCKEALDCFKGALKIQEKKAPNSSDTSITRGNLEHCQASGLF